MAESEGLLKLTEYLKQTRRQAEAAIDNLNGQLTTLQQENAHLRNHAMNLERQNAEFSATIQQLRTENSSKWKFKERDEWKALVDSIQKDRDRLQLEYNEASSQLGAAREEISNLKQDIERLTLERAERTAISEGGQCESDSHDGRDSPTSEYKQSSLTSPVFDRSGRDLFAEELVSPRSMAMRLKFELRRANEQATYDLERAEMELRSKELEIQRLEHELREQQLLRLVDNEMDDNNPQQSPYLWPGKTTMIAETMTITKTDGWFDVFLGIFGSNRSSAEIEALGSKRKIMQV